MIEIMFKGRGGQGAVVASEILGRAFFLERKYPQCFSLFGGERRGAPVTAFLRVDDEPVLLKCQIKQAGPILPLIKEVASPLSANEVHREFMRGAIPEHLKGFGISYVMQIINYKELSRKFHIIHVTEGLTPEQVGMMNMTYSNNLQHAVDEVAKSMPEADVAIFPSGGNIIPEVRPIE